MDKPDLLRKSLQRIQALKAQVSELEAELHEPVAIVGIGARFPGGVTSATELWAALLDGFDGIGEIPEQRWPSGEAGARFAGLLDGVHDFDPGFFGLSDREARMMDPQQRLLLEVGWDALANAGLSLDELRGSSTGVYAGAIGQDWALFALGDPDQIDAYSSTGVSHAVVANRLSYLWDLHGPSISVDAACASSLVAVHLAVNALRRRECDLALAGGVQLHLAPHSTLSLYRFNMMAGDGRCKAFDARADGFVRAEGCGVVVLKRLSEVRPDHDRVYAVIHGSALNQDGRSNGLTAPNALAQARVLGAALRDARREPGEVSYIETHGTGTALGDPIEFEAIKSVYGAGSDGRFFLGAIKTNIGHAEAAAGIAGLIKAALAIHEGVIPPNLHFERPNPALGLEGSRFEVPTAATPWTGPRYAGVSSFGFGGTNAHVILGPAPSPEPASEQEVAREPVATSEVVAVPVSGHTRAACSERGRQLGVLAAGEVAADLAYTSALRTTPLAWRAVAVGASRERLAADLAKLRPALSPGKAPRVVFLFPGQGGQWLDMGRSLAAWSPVFRAALDEVDRTIEAVAGWSLSSALRSKAELERVDRVQPAIFAIQVASSALWRSLGVDPDLVIGTSMGEVAAAHVAGLLGLEDAVRVIAGRSRLVADRLDTPGAMATVALSEDEVRRRLAQRSTDLEIAVVNSPSNVVVAGSPEPVDALLAELEADGVFARRIKVDYASHCSHVESLSKDLERELGGLRRPEGPRVPMLSTVTRGWLDDASSARYWQDNLRKTVELWPALTEVLRPKGDLIVELSPHPVLTVPLADPLAAIDSSTRLICAMTRDSGPEEWLRALGAAWSHGVGVDWSALYPGGRLLALPSYPWQRRSFATGPRSLGGGLGVGGAPGTVAQPEPAPALAEAGGSLEEFALATIAHELGVSSTAEVRLDLPLRELGFDSLMASHLRAALAEREVEVKLLDILQAPSVQQLLDGLAEPASAIVEPGASGAWFVCPKPRPEAERVMICLPFGGGAANAFRHWGARMPQWLEIRAAEFPGRGTRLGETWSETFEELAAELSAAIIREVDRPFALYGHCSGSVVAYETTQRLVAAGRAPEHLFVAALRSPPKYQLDNMIAAAEMLDGMLHEQEDEHLMNFLRSINFSGVEAFERDPELRELALATLRADSRAGQRYRYVEAEPLPVPITAIGGGQDPTLNAYDLWSWAKHTSERFDWRWLASADHYFQADHVEQLAEIFEVLRAAELPKPRPLLADELAPLEVVRSFYAARGDGLEAWAPFVAEDAELLAHGPVAPFEGRHRMRAWLAELPAVAKLGNMQDLCVDAGEDDSVVASCRITLELTGGASYTGTLREQFRVRDGRIVAGETRFEAQG